MDRLKNNRVRQDQTGQIGSFEWITVANKLTKDYVWQKMTDRRVYVVKHDLHEVINEELGIP